MIRYTFYKVFPIRYSNCFGTKFDVKEVDYMTNDNGCGIFRADGSQITGNGQFCGDEKKLLKWLNVDFEYSEERFFKSESYAKRYAKKKSLENPITKIPLQAYTIGSIMNFFGSDVKILEQTGEIVTVEYVNEPGHTTTTEFYNLN